MPSVGTASKGVPSNKQRLRVLFISTGLAGRFGGTAFSESTLAASLSEFCEVNILCPKGRVDTDFAAGFGVRGINEFSKGDFFSAWLNPAHSFHEKLSGVDIVHINGHWAWENYFLSRLCLRKKIPYVLHPRGMMWVGHRRILIKKIFNVLLGNRLVRDASGVIALSHYETGQFAPYSIAEDRVGVIPNGIVEPQASPRSYSGIRTPYFLYVGRLEQRKNLNFLIDAFDGYQKQGGQASLGLMGPVERGYDDELRDQIARLKLEHRVALLDPVYGDEKWSAIRGALAVLYPTKNEAFGRVPFEALAVGTLAVVPDESGSAEYLKLTVPQCLYRAGELNSLVSVLAKISSGAIESGAVGRAKAWVLTELSPRLTAEQIYNFYLRALR